MIFPTIIYNNRLRVTLQLQMPEIFSQCETCVRIKETSVAERFARFARVWSPIIRQHVRLAQPLGHLSQIPLECPGFRSVISLRTRSHGRCRLSAQLEFIRIHGNAHISWTCKFSLRSIYFAMLTIATREPRMRQRDHTLTPFNSSLRCKWEEGNVCVACAASTTTTQNDERKIQIACSNVLSWYIKKKCDICNYNRIRWNNIRQKSYFYSKCYYNVSDNNPVHVYVCCYYCFSC